MLNYYRILGIPQDADVALIKSAYRSLAKEFHPDRNPGDPYADELFRRINDAYQTLSDPDERWQHDQVLSQPVAEKEEEGRFTNLFDPDDLEEAIRERLRLPAFSIKLMPPSHWILLALFALYLLVNPADRLFTVLKLAFWVIQVVAASYWVHATLVHLKFRTKFSWGPVLVAHVVAFASSVVIFILLGFVIWLLAYYFPLVAELWRSL